MPRQPKAGKLIDRRIDEAYRRTCADVQIKTMDIPKVYAAGRNFIAKGANDEVLSVAIRAYVDAVL